MKYTISEDIGTGTGPSTPREYSKYAMAPVQLGQDGQEIHSNPLKSAGFGTIAGGSFIDDRNVLLQHYASARFPDEPNAIDRYGISDDGLIYYQADDGKAYAEIPNDNSLSSLAKSSLQNIGKTLPFAAGLGTGIATAPMLLGGPPGVAASAGLTAGAAGLGESARQWIGNAFYDDPIHSAEIASETAFGAGGQVLAGGMAKFAGRHAARDLSRMDVGATNALGQQADDLGIRLSPAEQTNLRTLTAKENVLKELPDSASIMDDFKMAQQEDVSRATGKFFNALSPIDDALPAGQMAREAAQDAGTRIAANRAAQARPYYEKAFAEAPPVNIESVIRSINERLAQLHGKGPIAGKLKKIKSLLVNKVDGTEFLEDSLEVLHMSFFTLNRPLISA